MAPRSRLAYFICLQPLLSLHYVKGYLVAFLQASEAFSLDGTKMHEYVRAIEPADKAKTLGVIEPFHRASFTLFRHTITPFSSNRLDIEPTGPPEPAAYCNTPWSVRKRRIAKQAQ